MYTYIVSFAWLSEARSGVIQSVEGYCETAIQFSMAEELLCSAAPVGLADTP
jgi:hypothetical protein